MQNTHIETPNKQIVHSILKSRIESLSLLLEQIKDDEKNKEKADLMNFVEKFKPEIVVYKEKLTHSLDAGISYEQYLNEFQEMDTLLFEKITQYVDLRLN